MAFVVAWAAFGIFLLTISVKQESDWYTWADTHCEIIGVEASRVVTGATISTNGTVGVSSYVISGKKQYECDDGVTYWR